MSTFNSQKRETKMKYKKIKLSTLILGIGITTQAQQTSNITGGDALGSGGTVAYSVGQVVYNTYSGATGTITQGIQQAYEISIVLGVEEHQISLNMQAYPNPTTGYLTLSIDNIEHSTFNFQLYDISGNLIENQKIANTTEIIHIENSLIGTYYLKVISNNKEVKTFKIIKN